MAERRLKEVVVDLDIGGSGGLEVDVLVVPGEGGRTEGAQPHVEHVEEEGKGDEDLQGGEDLQGKRTVSGKRETRENTCVT